MHWRPCAPLGGGRRKHPLARRPLCSSDGEEPPAGVCRNPPLVASPPLLLLLPCGEVRSELVLAASAQSRYSAAVARVAGGSAAARGCACAQLLPVAEPSRLLHRCRSSSSCRGGPATTLRRISVQSAREVAQVRATRFCTRGSAVKQSREAARAGPSAG